MAETPSPNGLRKSLIQLGTSEWYIRGRAPDLLTRSQVFADLWPFNPVKNDSGLIRSIGIYRPMFGCDIPLGVFQEDFDKLYRLEETDVVESLDGAFALQRLHRDKIFAYQFRDLYFLQTNKDGIILEV